MGTSDPDSRFLSTLSHDLRGGIHSVQLAMEMLRGDVLENVPMEQLLSDVELARRSLVETGARAERIICARRIQRSEMPVRVSETDAVSSIQNAVRVTSLSEEDAPARVHIELPDRAVFRTDTRLAGELVAGLLDYTLRSVPAGKIRVLLDAGGLLEFSVDRAWITPEVSAMLVVATNDPPFGDATLGLYVAAGAARLLNTPIRTVSERSLQVSLIAQTVEAAS